MQRAPVRNLIGDFVVSHSTAIARQDADRLRRIDGASSPRLTSPSCSPRIKACKPATTASVVGSGTVSEKTPHAMPAFSICSRNESASPIRTRTASVTIRGCLTPRRLRMLTLPQFAPPPTLIIDGTRTSTRQSCTSFLFTDPISSDPNIRRHGVLLSGL